MSETYTEVVFTMITTNEEYVVETRVGRLEFETIEAAEEFFDQSPMMTDRRLLNYEYLSAANKTEQEQV